MPLKKPLGHSLCRLNVLTNCFSISQANYNIRVPIYKRKDTGDGNFLKLVFYLLMVHKENNFSHLTCNSPQLRASCHTHPVTGTSVGGLGGIRSRSTTPSTSDNEGEEAESAKVCAHRRKSAFGSLSRGSAASRVVLDKTLIDEQIRGVQTHLETTVRNAAYYVRRDELWKRLLYGKERNVLEPKPVHVSRKTDLLD